MTTTVVVVLVDDSRLDQARSHGAAGLVSMPAGTDYLLCVIGLGRGGGVLLPGQPPGSRLSVRWPNRLGPPTRDEASEVLTCIFEAAHLVGDGEPAVHVEALVHWPAFSELRTALGSLPRSTIHDRPPPPDETAAGRTARRSREQVLAASGPTTGGHGALRASDAGSAPRRSPTMRPTAPATPARTAPPASPSPALVARASVGSNPAPVSNGPAKTGARRLLKAPAWALGIAAMVVVVAVGVFVLRTMGIDAGLEPGTASSLIAGFCLVAAAYLGYELRREGEGLVAFALLLCSLISALYGSALQIPILEQAFHPIDRATFGVAQLRSSPVLFQDLSVGQCAADWGAWGDDVVAWVVPCDRPHYMQYFGRPDDDGQCEHDLLSHAVEAAMQEWRIDVFVLEGPPAACFLMPADESGQEADLSRYTEENLIK